MTRFLAVSAVALLASLPAAAQNFEQSDFKIFLGAGAFVTPDYLGSDESELALSPDVEVTWQDRFFLSSRDGLGVYMMNSPGILFGVGLSPEWGRDEDSNSRLTGLGDVDPGINVNIFADVPVRPFILHAGVQQEFAGGHGGTLINGAVSYTQPVTDQLAFTLTPSTTWASKEYLRSYYGVNAAQSSASGYAVNPINEDGFRDVSLGGKINYAVTPNWNVYGAATWMHLMGDAADSAITRDEDQFFFGAGLGWRFPANAVPNASVNTNLPVYDLADLGKVSTPN